MTPQEVERAIVDAVSVTPTLLSLAKMHLMAGNETRTNLMVRSFIVSQDALVDQPVQIGAAADQGGVVRQVARYLSCDRAAREAIWALIGSGSLVPNSERLEAGDLGVSWTTVGPGGGMSSGWGFGPAIAVPAQVLVASSAVTHLTDGDLFLTTLALPGLDEGIAESLRDAVRCFRQDLYLPAHVMLGRAVEGAWTLVGEALVAAAPTETAAVSLGEALARGIHFARLPERVSALYTHQAYAAVVHASGVSHADLRGVIVWTEALRLARNAVHHAVDAPLPATWETTAALFMGAVPNLRALWAIREAL